MKLNEYSSNENEICPDCGNSILSWYQEELMYNPGNHSDWKFDTYIGCPFCGREYFCVSDPSDYGEDWEETFGDQPQEYVDPSVSVKSAKVIKDLMSILRKEMPEIADSIFDKANDGNWPCYDNEKKYTVDYEVFMIFFWKSIEEK